MAVRNPLVVVNGRPVTLPSGDTLPAAAVPSFAHVIDLIGFQNTAITTASLTDVLIAGSDFLWNTAYLPAGRSSYLEVVGNGSIATSAVVVTLYTAAGVAVVGSATTPTGTAIGRGRSAALTLADNTSYQVRFRANLASTASIKSVRLILI